MSSEEKVIVVDHSVSAFCRIPLLTALLLLATLSPVSAANYPGWWITRGVVDTNASAEDYAVCTSGQLKTMALQAMNELDADLPGGAGNVVHTMVNGWINNTANAQDYSAINAGQLKTVAAPFYDCLRSNNWPCILPDGMTTNQNYPWSGTGAQDYSMANNGQVKYVFSFSVVNVKINGDYNRNGNPADDPHKDDPVTFAGPKGFVILANNNDSDGDGQPDCEPDSVSGQYTIRNNDLSDIYQICIPKLGIPASAIPSGMTVSVQVLNPTNDTPSFDAIVFPKIQAGIQGGAGLDFDTASAVGTYFGGTGTAILGIEGRTSGNEVRIRITVKINGNTLGTDEMRVLIAPWMALSNDRPVTKIYSGFGDDAAFANDMNALFGSANIAWVDGVIWRQDEGEFGYTRTGVGQSVYAMRSDILDLSSTSDDFKALISPSKGWDASIRTTFVHTGGGVEVSVPDANYPYGRLILSDEYSGSTGCAFFERQKIQWPPIFLPVAWLKVGHVDEVMSIVPYGSSSVICVGDLTNAIAILKDYTTYPTNEVESTDYYSRAFLVSLYTNPAYATAVATIQGYLDSAATNLCTQLGVTIVRIPVAYTLEYTGSGSCKTFLPNSINAAVANIGGTVKVGSPDPRFAPFRQVIANRLSFLGSNQAWINCEGPHAVAGEAHCASNPDKNPPTGP